MFNYLFDYRMNIAIHYLLDTNKSIGEVAGLVGYEHQALFVLPLSGSLMSPRLNIG